MKKSTKAVLLSAFIYPGVGHIVLKRYVSAAGLIVAASASLYILVSNAVTKALQISDKIINGEIQPDIEVIRDLISKQQTAEETQLITIATTVLIIVWLIGIFDSYRFGRTQERNTVIDE